MDAYSARLGKDGTVLCGRPDAAGRLSCDAPLADVVRLGRGGRSARRLAALAGWAQDRKGIWQQTTRVADLRRHGIAQAQPPPERRTFITVPALARCPKCRTVQWLAAEQLGVAGGDEPSRSAASRWLPQR